MSTYQVTYNKNNPRFQESIEADGMNYGQGAVFFYKDFKEGREVTLLLNITEISRVQKVESTSK